MTEESRTLWVGNLDSQTTDELLYELFLQTGPIDRLILPTEGEGDSKQHKGHAYVVFKHTDSVQYASQVLEGSSLFGHTLALKARSLPVNFKTTSQAPSFKGRSDPPGRPGFNKATTWHGQSDYGQRGRGGFRGRGGSNFNQNNSGFNAGFNNFNNQANSNFWIGGQQNSGDSQTAQTTNTNDSSMEEKRQRLLQQQNLTLEAHRQIQQGVMNMASQMYNMSQQQQQQQQQGMWAGNGYNSNWTMGGNTGDNSGYQNYTTDQYGNWYPQQQQ